MIVIIAVVVVVVGCWCCCCCCGCCCYYCSCSCSCRRRRRRGRRCCCLLFVVVAAVVVVAVVVFVCCVYICFLFVLLLLLLIVFLSCWQLRLLGFVVLTMTILLYCTSTIIHPTLWVWQLPKKHPADLSGVVKSLEEVDGASAKLVDYHSSTYSCEDSSSSCDISWPELRRRGCFKMFKVNPAR